MINSATSQLADRLTSYADALRQTGAIRTPAVHTAFATVPRHRFLPHFRYRSKEYILDTDHEPPGEVLDIVYANNSLLTHTGRNGEPPSSSSAPSIMAKMLEALDLHPSLRTLEIGAGTGYNAALIHHITRVPVVTIESGQHAATEATTTLHALGLHNQVHVIQGDGYSGYPDGGPYDRLIVTCGIAGIPRQWLSQLAPQARIIAPVAHAGVHPILSATRHHSTGTLKGRALLWGDFMPAAGALRPIELFHHNPADNVPTTGVQHIPGVGPVLDHTDYHDLWCYLGTRDPRITRAYPDGDVFDLTLGLCALVEPGIGAAWIHTNGSMTTTGDPTIGGYLADLVHDWNTASRPNLTDWTIAWQATPGNAELLRPHRWQRHAP